MKPQKISKLRPSKGCVLRVHRVRPLTAILLQKSPVSGFQGEKIKPKIGLTPILRAGLGMTNAMVNSFLPDEISAFKHLYSSPSFRQ